MTETLIDEEFFIYGQHDEIGTRFIKFHKVLITKDVPPVFEGERFGFAMLDMENRTISFHISEGVSAATTVNVNISLKVTPRNDT